SGAPMPLIFAAEHKLILVYEVAPAGDDVTILSFLRPYAHSFGPPNDEALHGHPLYRLGLKPYGHFEVISSPWARGLERMNRVHPYHDPSRFDALRHFVFTFHDRLFECLALDVTTIATIRNDAGSDRKLLDLIGEQMQFLL